MSARPAPRGAAAADRTFYRLSRSGETGFDRVAGTLEHRLAEAVRLASALDNRARQLK